MRLVLLFALVTCGAGAQTFTQPPALIRVGRSLGTNAAAIQPYSDAGAQVNVVAMTSITGPAETWLIEAYHSFGAIENIDKTIHLPADAGANNLFPADEILAAARAVIAVYRPGFSYRPEQAIQAFQKARFMQVLLYRVRPGTESEFVELVKSRGVLRDSINLDRPEMAYQVISGAAGGTYLFLAPLPSLSALDEGLARAPAYAQGAVAAARGSEVARKHLLFRVEPGMSWVSDEFASADAGFWRGQK
jgi:hypothetical protein